MGVNVAVRCSMMCAVYVPIVGEGNVLNFVNSPNLVPHCEVLAFQRSAQGTPIMIYNRNKYLHLQSYFKMNGSGDIQE